jgi:hypothetical protein
MVIDEHKDAIRERPESSRFDRSPDQDSDSDQASPLPNHPSGRDHKATDPGAADTSRWARACRPCTTNHPAEISGASGRPHPHDAGGRGDGARLPGPGQVPADAGTGAGDTYQAEDERDGNGGRGAGVAVANRGVITKSWDASLVEMPMLCGSNSLNIRGNGQWSASRCQMVPLDG